MPARGVGENELASAVEFDWQTAGNRIESVRPGDAGIPSVTTDERGSDRILGFPE